MDAYSKYTTTESDTIKGIKRLLLSIGENKPLDLTIVGRHPSQQQHCLMFSSEISPNVAIHNHSYFKFKGRTDIMIHLIYLFRTLAESQKLGIVK